MDFDLEIISEEGRSHDPLFSSIINAMNSMKEATADKIYQKIQRGGSTNYSKPQVDRALERALNYGIFEVKNNRYRVRDDFLDDVDTVYWKMQRKREETPFRIQEGTNEKHLGQTLDPERDNLRFKKISDPETSECPQCGRTKRPKLRSISPSQDKNLKVRRLAGMETDLLNFADQRYYFMPGGGKYDTTDESELDSLSFFSDDEQSFGSYKNNTRQKQKPSNLCRFDSEYEDAVLKDDNEHKAEMNESRSKDSLKSESNSDMSSITNEASKNNFDTNFYENVPYTSKESEIKDETQYFNNNSSYGREEADECGKKSDWAGYMNDPNGAVIQTNNVLTIEPMDLLAFKGLEHTSYIS